MLWTEWMTSDHGAQYAVIGLLTLGSWKWAILFPHLFIHLFVTNYVIETTTIIIKNAYVLNGVLMFCELTMSSPNLCYANPNLPKPYLIGWHTAQPIRQQASMNIYHNQSSNICIRQPTNKNQGYKVITYRKWHPISHNRVDQSGDVWYCTKSHTQ